MKLVILWVFLLQPAAFADNSPLISHDLWNELLGKHVTAEGKVNYKNFKSDEKKLQVYLTLLESNPPQPAWSRQEKMAYWINAYNAYTVKLILSAYPCKSILDLEGGKPWDKKFIAVGKERYSLNQVEHDILRREFRDARIHFAVNCASISCPKLLNEAFLPASLEQQLQSVSRSFINDPARNTITATAVQVSKIFDWYKEDFSTNGTLMDFLNRYSSVKIAPDAAVTYRDYDWALNE